MKYLFSILFLFISALAISQRRYDIATLFAKNELVQVRNYTSGASPSGPGVGVSFLKSPTQGNVLYLFFLVNGQTITTPPSGYTLDVSNTGGSDKIYCYRKTALNGESSLVSFTLSAAADVVAVFVEFTGFPTSDASATGSINGSTAGNTISGATVAGSRDLMFAFAGYEPLNPNLTQGPFSWSNGFTQLGTSVTTKGGGIEYECALAYKIVSAATSTVITSTAQSSSFSGWMQVSYKP